MSLRYDNDIHSTSPASYAYNSSTYLPFSSDINYVNYTLLDSAAVIDPSLTSFHLTDTNNNGSSSSSYHGDRYSYLQSPPKRRYMPRSTPIRPDHGHGRINHSGGGGAYQRKAGAQLPHRVGH